MIQLEKIFINNYRKFIRQVITLDDQVTAIAGANNAGKTSLIELMSSIFMKEKREKIKIEDMSSQSRLNDELVLKKILVTNKLNNDEKKRVLSKVHKKLNKITVGLVIKYDEYDNLEYFSNYLADVDIDKKNYYFIVEYEYLPVNEGDIEDIFKGTTDLKDKFSELKNRFSFLQPKIYYCDENFQNKIQIEDKNKFYRLFNYHCVYAVRKLADTSEEKQNLLSKHLLNTVRNNENWKNNLQQLIKKINELLNDQGLSKEIDVITLEHLKSTLDGFSKTNGGNTGKIGVDFRLENEDIEKVLLDFIHIYYEQEKGMKIKEQKQGLGYSNLIYLLLSGQIFNDEINPKKINLLVFEEPEAHLHPQMEHIFIRYLSVINKVEEVLTDVVLTESLEEPEALTLFEAAVTEKIEEEGSQKSNVPFQMLITTHSNEMTKTIGINKVRILRSSDLINSKVYDLNNFMKSLKDNKIETFYNKFFQFNMVEMIFADKIILFEGDAERMLFKYLISNMSNYEELSAQYISYIQVGGAYAHNYLNLIKFLEIKTLIFTDIDYEYNNEDIQIEPSELLQNILKRETTNETIKQVIKKNIISEIYDKYELVQNFTLNNNICLKFQTKHDGYARTLEDALLQKLLGIDNVFSTIEKTKFIEYKTDKKLLLSSPKGDKTSLRDRIDKLSNKTDFMYSLIDSNYVKDAIPNYIEEGLEWLKN